MVDPPLYFGLTPPDYRALDAIIGRMVRELIAFEGRPATREVYGAIDAVVYRARQDATQLGFGTEAVDEVAKRMTFQGPGLTL